VINWDKNRVIVIIEHLKIESGNFQKRLNSFVTHMMNSHKCFISFRRFNYQFWGSRGEKNLFVWPSVKMKLIITKSNYRIQTSLGRFFLCSIRQYMRRVFFHLNSLLTASTRFTSVVAICKKKYLLFLHKLLSR